MVLPVTRTTDTLPTGVASADTAITTRFAFSANLAASCVQDIDLSVLIHLIPKGLR